MQLGEEGGGEVGLGRWEEQRGSGRRKQEKEATRKGCRE